MNFISSVLYAQNFSMDKIPAMEGKVYIVTGGNSGIGKVTVRELAKHGAQVILACRSMKRGQEALEDIKKEVEHCQIELMELDLSSLKSIHFLWLSCYRALSETFANVGGQVHLRVSKEVQCASCACEQRWCISGAFSTIRGRY
jgi:NAD(P)-dependent dehydrogenase (short-subunit alcohol dehydrogenase family)